MKVVVIDSETTDKTDPELIEFAAITLTGDSMEEE